MKSIKLLAIAVMSALASCGSKAATNTDAETTETADPPKVLVAYFSATGTTKAVAEVIAEATDATLYEITPDPLYTDEDLDWRNKESRSSVEMNSPACRPDIAGEPIDVAEYDIIFLG